MAEFRGTSAHFQSTFSALFKQLTSTLLTLSALTRWIHFSKCSYAYRTVHWDVNLHWNRWSPSAHVCKVAEFRGTSAHFQSTFSALFKQLTSTLLTLLALTRWIHFSKCSYAYRTVHWDVNLHWNRWSPSAHVCKVAEFRGTSAHFQSTFSALFKQLTSTLLTLSALTRWIHFSKCSYAYRTVHWDVNLHWNRWSPSAHVCKVAEFRGTSAHFQSTFSALFKQLTVLC